MTNHTITLHIFLYPYNLLIKSTKLVTLSSSLYIHKANILEENQVMADNKHRVWFTNPWHMTPAVNHPDFTITSKVFVQKAPSETWRLLELL